MRATPRFAATAAALLTGVAAVAAAIAPAAAAATLTQVTGFGSNPGALNMYAYVPAGLPAGAPLVLALHGCGQSASDYYGHSGWPKYADLYGFAVVFPEQPSASNPILQCFDWGTPSDDGRGQGEALSVYQMVQYAEAHYASDPHRVYVTGLSAGGGLTADLLADYPDVFAAGAIDSGPPTQCSTSGIFNSNCTSGTTTHTPAQWGDLVRAADPGYGGPWPRVAIWQGTSDTTVNPAALTESRDQWTNVWGIGQTPSRTLSLPGGTTENVYDDITGTPAVVTFAVSGMTHGLAVAPGSAPDQCGTTGTYYLNYLCSSYYTAQFFGLATTGTPTPTPTPTPTVTPSPTPTPTPTPTGQCFTDDNYHQTVAGRAHQVMGSVYANGSNQAMGLWNVFVTHTLEQTGPNYYVIADGTC